MPGQALEAAAVLYEIISVGEGKDRQGKSLIKDAMHVLLFCTRTFSLPVLSASGAIQSQTVHVASHIENLPIDPSTLRLRVFLAADPLTTSNPMTEFSGRRTA